MDSDGTSRDHTERRDGTHIFMVGRLFILKVGTTLWFTLGDVEDDFSQTIFHDSILAECENANDWFNKGTVSLKWGDLGNYSPGAQNYHQIFAMERDDASGHYLFVVVKITHTVLSAYSASNKTDLFTQEMSPDRANRLLAFLMDRSYG